MIVEDFEDPNEHALGLALVKVMKTPGSGIHFEEVAVSLVRAVESEGWIPPEERDRAERERNAAQMETGDALAAAEKANERVAELEKQVANLIDALAEATRVSAPVTIRGGGGIISTPSTGAWGSGTTGITYTTNSTSISAEDAMVKKYVQQYADKKRRAA